MRLRRPPPVPWPEVEELATRPRRAPARETAGRAGGAMFVIGVLLLSFNLRPAVTAVPSVLDEIGRHQGYSSVVLTVLTTVPVVCFAVFSPVAGRLGRRLGDERGLGLAIAAIAGGQLLRVAVPDGGFFPGTVIACAGIAVINVLLSSLVKRRAPRRAAQLLGAYLAMLYLGAMAGSAASVPLYRTDHSSLRWALGIWALPAALAAVAWLPQLGRRTLEPEPTIDAEPSQPGAAPNGPGHPSSARPSSGRSSLARYLARSPLARSPLAWSVTAYMGLQSLTFYASLSILPDLYRSRGLDASTAGLVNTMLSVGGVVTAVLAPVVVARFGIGRAVLVASTVAATAATIAPLFVPLGAALPTAFVLGLGQGVSIALALYFIMARAATAEVAGALSAMAQGVGYLIAVVGPLAAGLLHSLTRSWDGSIAFLAVVTVATLGFGLRAAQDRVITPSGSTVPG